MTDKTKLEDFCDDGDEFQDILDSAVDNADPGRQEEFVLDIKVKWDTYGLSMFMSSAQWEWLNKLADTG